MLSTSFHAGITEFVTGRENWKVHEMESVQVKSSGNVESIISLGSCLPKVHTGKIDMDLLPNKKSVLYKKKM